jgi:long-chain acyl-CoA synthetase
MNSPIVEHFLRVLRDSPLRPLVFLPVSDTALTATSLWDAAHCVREALEKARVNPRGLLVVSLGNRPEYIATFLACRMRNQPLCPVDASTTSAELDAIATQLGASAVLTYSDPAAPFNEGPGVETKSAAELLTPAIALSRPAYDPGDSRHGDRAVLLKLTSGSTGTPRAALTPESVLLSDSEALMGTMQVGRDDTQIAAIPLSHAYGIGSLLVPLLIYGTPIVMRDSFVPHRLPEDARRYGARTFPGVPYMFDHFVQNPPRDGWPSTLRNLMSAGALLETNAANRFRQLFGIKIHPFYGTSETGGITYDSPDAPAEDGLVGTVLPGVSIEFVSEDGAPEGGGRVLVRGPSVVLGYADGVDPGSFVDGGFLTGDLGALNDAGQLVLAGRISSFVNVAGRKVQPDEVERVLRTYDGVTDVRVLGVADDRRGEQLVACLVIAGPQPSLLALRQFCGSRLASHKIPRAFLFLDRIPLTDRGKTDRVRLRELVNALMTQTDML